MRGLRALLAFPFNVAGTACGLAAAFFFVLGAIVSGDDE